MAFLEPEVAARMVSVMVGIENMRQAPAATVERSVDCLGIGRIDRRGQPGCGIVQQEAVIVAEARKLDDLKVGHDIRCRDAWGQPIEA